MLSYMLAILVGWVIVVQELPDAYLHIIYVPVQTLSLICSLSTIFGYC